MDRQQEFVLRTIEERDIRFVRLWFTDVLGTLKSVAIAPAELEGAFAEGIGFDGSVIEGFARIYEADMLAKPDPSTFQVLPWRGESPGTARMFCDLTLPDGTPSMADPRHVLQRALTKAADLGFTFYTHPEIEFFLLKQGWVPGTRPEPIDQAGYFDHVPHGNSHDFRRAAIGSHNPVLEFVNRMTLHCLRESLMQQGCVIGVNIFLEHHVIRRRRPGRIQPVDAVFLL